MTAILTDVDTDKDPGDIALFEIHPSSWAAAVDSSDPRDQFHRTALWEAWGTTERRPCLAVEAQPRPGIARMRLAFAGGTHATTEPCTCPA